MESDQFPDESNLFGCVTHPEGPKSVANLFAQHGWHVRKCSWTDYEVRCEFADLVIESQNPVLIHGPVADLLTNLPRIVEPLATAGVPYSIEGYNAKRELIRHVRG